jgi:pimeloyl-ACP methyl ester carboxylesterase
MVPIRRLAVLVLAVVWVALPAPAVAQAHFEGAIGPGSLYEIDVPPTWNGSLVLFAHAIVQADQPLAPPSGQEGFNGIRAALLAGGYAVAASSYSSNGWALADAVQRTHQLNGIFVSKVGRPAYTYLAGASLGALVVVKLAERFPGQYDGVLAMCGPLGGALTELQYVGDARVTFDYYFPGLLPGSPFSVPPGTVFDPAQGTLFGIVAATLAANPAKVLQWASAAHLPYADANELAQSALYVIGFDLSYTNDLIERVNGKIPYDNRTTVYQVNVGPDPLVNAILSAQLNQGVARYDADRAALNYYDRNYTPDGAIAVPVLTLHTLRDPAIPFAHEALYAAAVAAQGRSTLLVQRPVNRWGHCAFTPAEVQTAFADLVTWVRLGIRPAP